MSLVLDALGFVLLLAGGLLALVGGTGLLRFPDFYSRLHAASVTETLALSLIIFGLLTQAQFTSAALKLLLIFGFMLFTGPVATHALARAARHGRLAPLLGSQAPERASASEPDGETSTSTSS